MLKVKTFKFPHDDKYVIFTITGSSEEIAELKGALEENTSAYEKIKEYSPNEIAIGVKVDSRSAVKKDCAKLSAVIRAVAKKDLLNEFIEKNRLYDMPSTSESEDVRPSESE